VNFERNRSSNFGFFLTFVTGTKSRYRYPGGVFDTLFFLHALIVLFFYIPFLNCIWNHIGGFIIVNFVFHYYPHHYLIINRNRRAVKELRHGFFSLYMLYMLLCVLLSTFSWPVEPFRLIFVVEIYKLYIL